MRNIFLYMLRIVNIDRVSILVPRNGSA